MKMKHTAFPVIPVSLPSGFGFARGVRPLVYSSQVNLQLNYCELRITAKVPRYDSQ